MMAAKKILDRYQSEMGDAEGMASQDIRVQALLMAMSGGDQQIRKLFLSMSKSCDTQRVQGALHDITAVGKEIDRVNTMVLKNIIISVGWPSVSKYGVEADKAAFLVAQHTDRDVVFQSDVLDILSKLVASKETDPENYALLYDRVHLQSEGYQRYGTQGECKNDKFVTANLENAEAVDARRKSLGLEPLGDYVRKAARLRCGTASDGSP
jgi:hypothetical protein